MQDALDVVDAVLGLEAEREIERLSDAAWPRPTEPEDEASLRERLDDHVSTAQVAQAYRRSAAAVGLAASEDRRRGLRALAPRFLARASTEVEAELTERRSRHEIPAIGFAAALACEGSPAERDALFARWLALERDLTPARAGRAEARASAARQVGAAGVAELLAAAHPVAARGLLDPFERGAIAPLDEAAQRAAAALWRRHGRGGGRAPGDASRVHHLMSHAPWVTREGVVAIVRRLAAENGPAGAGRVEVARASAVGAGATWRLTRAGRAWVGVGVCAGPAALRAALGALGRAARCAFVASTRGSSRARFGDAAFDHAADVLFGRLALCDLFRQAAQLPENDAVRVDLELHEAVATRLAWVYLQTVLANVALEGSAFDQSIARASGDPVTPAHREGVRDGDPAAATMLRGTVLGLLLEERLRLRFGRRWFESSRARSWLQSVWEAEPDHTAEELAAQAELGEIEPTPLLDASREALREGSGSGR